MAVKADMERCGLFKEMGYHTIGDKYPKTHVSLSKLLVCLQYLFITKLFVAKILLNFVFCFFHGYL